MKIIGHHLHSNASEYTIAEAIASSLDETSYGQGEWEATQDRLDAQARAIGAIVEFLEDAHPPGEVDDLIRSLLSYRFRVED